MKYVYLSLGLLYAHLCFAQPFNRGEFYYTFNTGITLSAHSSKLPHEVDYNNTFRYFVSPTFGVGYMISDSWALTGGVSYLALGDHYSYNYANLTHRWQYQNNYIAAPLGFRFFTGKMYGELGAIMALLAHSKIQVNEDPITRQSTFSKDNQNFNPLDIMAYAGLGFQHMVHSDVCISGGIRVSRGFVDIFSYRVRDLIPEYNEIYNHIVMLHIQVEYRF
jgi:hypothetical protein